MRRDYPYLQDPYYQDLKTGEIKRNFLAELDNFVNQKQYIKITLLNWNELPIKEIQGELSSGSLTKDGSSSVRRVCQLTAALDAGEYTVEDLSLDFSINKKVFIEIGVWNNTQQFKEYPILWFPQGVFYISSATLTSSTSSAVNINLQLKDKMCGLNGIVGGKFTSTTVFDEVETQTSSGSYVSEKICIYDIIQELVHHFGGENLENILIEDVPLRIKRVVKWIGTKPVYMVATYSDFYGTSYSLSLSKQENSTKYEYGEDIGYIYDDFTYTGDLTANAGETVVTILDKLISYLGNYEYFYDELGIFHFREKKNYLNTTQGKIVLNDMSENDYLIDTTMGKTIYSFSDNCNMASMTVNPQYENIRNDYVVQGIRTSTSTNNSYPVMYHIAIDNRPTVPTEGNKYTDILIYREPETSIVKAAFPLYVGVLDAKVEEDRGYLPDVGNFNIIYRATENNENHFYYWEDDVYKELVDDTDDEGTKLGTGLRYYSEDSSDTSRNYYVVQDWRTEMYIQGMMHKYDTTSANILNDYGEEVNIDYYFAELEAFWPQVYDLMNNTFYEGMETQGCYYLDMIEPYSSTLGEYCVTNIGRRTNVTKSDNVNCLFEPTIPDVCFILAYDGVSDRTEAEVTADVQECISQDQPYCQVKTSYYTNMATGGSYNSAYEQIKTDLWTYTDYQETIAMTALPVFYLDVNSRVLINDKTTNTYGDFMISNISIPFGAGSLMSVSASKCLEKV